MASNEEIPVGARVEIKHIQGARGIVRFSGQTQFQVGKWIGVELSEAKGRNDGTVQGVAYFKCKANYGVFVKPSQVAIVKEPEPTPGPSRARPSLGHVRTPSNGISRTPSLRSVQPSSPSSRSGSPSKTVASPAATATTFRASRLGASSTLAPPSPSKPTRPGASVVQTPGGLRRTGTAGSATSATSAASRRTSVIDTNLSASVSARNLDRESSRDSAPPTIRALPFKQPREREQPRAASPPLTTSQLRSVSGASQSSSLLSPLGSDLQVSQSPIHDGSDDAGEGVAPPSKPTVHINDEEVQELRSKLATADDELQSLRAKIRVLETHRQTDSRQIRELESRLSDAESFVALRPKLQAKLTQQQTDLIAARRELADAQQLAELNESRLLDAQESLEMAALDKEVAEERAEVAEQEVEELKERLAVAEVELGVLKDGTHPHAEGEEGEEDGGVDPAVAGSLAYIQLEKQNVRLKEALIRLRDVTQETDAEQRRRISDMEKDVQALDELQAELESAYIKLTNADTQIEDLKLQLDDALGAEDMLVQLTERNLLLGEKIEEMRITIEDLEALRELSDELEENHVETEKAMQDEINDKDVQLNAQGRKIDELNEACQDLEGTVVQFRELVMQLQTELDGLRAQTQTAQSESAVAASQTAQAMALNLRLQSHASKAHARALELELAKLEAREAKEMLSITAPHLPALYNEQDADAVAAYMFFKRMAAKAELINVVVAQVHGLPDILGGSVTDTLVGVTELRISIGSLAVSCRRFAAVLKRCDADSFLNAGRLYPELAPMERRVDMHIDLLRREEFREMECAVDVNKIMAQFEHLAETYFAGFEFDLGERELSVVASLDLELDMYMATIAAAKTSVGDILKDEELASDLAGLDPQKEFFEPMQRVLDHTKSAKTLSKRLTRRIEDLILDNSALKSHLVPELQAVTNHTAELLNFGISLAQQVMPYAGDARANHAPFVLSKVLGFVRETATSTVGKTRRDVGSPWEALGGAMAALINDANALLPVTMEGENVVRIAGSPPWTTRVAEIKANLAVNVEAERRAAQLSEELTAMARTLKARDVTLQEERVRTELMERRMEGVKRQQDAFQQVEAELAQARKQERSYEDALEQLQADLDAMEQENARLKAAVPSGNEKPAQAQQQEATMGIGMGMGYGEGVQLGEGSLETGYLLEQLEAFRGAVKFLRTENAYLRGADLHAEIAALPPLPAPSSPRPTTPPLVASTLADSDSEDEEGVRTPPGPQSIRELVTERKVLFRRVVAFAAAPKIVDLSARPKRGWVPKSKLPEAQVLARKLEAERLGRKVRGLVERTNLAVAAIH
ncbi:unnamed protein product [Peniophora sp. CBMAI 1063]|nr:unnamed protein product [Peniophora sp. CBMAI 1063]